jgi:hypothetical protein
MTDYKAIQNLLSHKGLPRFIFYTKGEKPVKAVIRHMPNNTSSEDITVALQELGYEVFSVKQMTAKRPSLEGGVTFVCYNFQRFGYIWFHCRKPPRCMWCGATHRHRECPEENTPSISSCCKCKLRDGESPHPTKYRGCSNAKEELQRRKHQRMSNQGSSGRTALRGSVKSKQPSENQKESAGPQKKQVTQKASGQSMQEEI